MLDLENPWTQLNRLHRPDVQALLESTGTAVYDDEPMKDLLECLLESVEAGDIDPSEIL